MFELDKKSLNRTKSATSLAELLVIMVIIGILSVVMMKTFNRDTIATKYLYSNAINSIQAYAKNGLSSPSGLDWDTAKGTNICAILADDSNTIGAVNCATDYSSIPDKPNFTTTSGMRFYGLDTGFVLQESDLTPIDPKDQYIIIQVDIDGAQGDNMQGSDILAMELHKDATVIPVDIAAKDPAIVAATITRIYDGVNAKMVKEPMAFVDGAVTRTQFSYDEAACRALGTASRNLNGSKQNCTNNTISFLVNGELVVNQNVTQLANCLSPNICKVILPQPKALP